MKAKSLNISKLLIRVLVTFFLLLSISALILSIANLINFNAELSQYLYLLLGIFVIPMEFMISKNLSSLTSSGGKILATGVSAGVVVLFVVCLVLLSTMFNERASARNRKDSGYSFVLLMVILFAYLTFGLLTTATNFDRVSAILNSFESGILKTIAAVYRHNVLLIVIMGVYVLGMALTLFTIVRFCLWIFKRPAKTKVVYSSNINFYSKQYEPQLEEEVKISKDDNAKEETIEVKDIPESNLKAKNLIYKIMELEELKKQNKISDVEYTKLRQRAIRRYKK